MPNDRDKGKTTQIAMSNDPPQGGQLYVRQLVTYRWLPSLTGGSGRPLTRILNRAAGVSNKSNI
eukprot:3986431-Heterocapsa_arctica.AAC.1